jgi:hypothetical protein
MSLHNPIITSLHTPHEHVTSHPHTYSASHPPYARHVTPLQHSTSHVDRPRHSYLLKATEFKRHMQTTRCPGGQSPACHRGEPASIPEQFVRNLWWIGDKFLSLKFHFPLSINIKPTHQCFNGTHPSFGRVTTDTIQAAASQTHRHTPPHHNYDNITKWNHIKSTTYEPESEDTRKIYCVRILARALKSTKISDSLCV